MYWTGHIWTASLKDEVKNDYSNVAMLTNLTTVENETNVSNSTPQLLLTTDSGSGSDSGDVITPTGLGVEELTISEGILYIGSSAFVETANLTELTLPSTLLEIGNTAFAGCSSLETVSIPRGVRIIYAGAFIQCTSLKTVYIPSSVLNMGDLAFAGIADDATITCEFSAKPEGWSARWTNCENIVWQE